MCAWRFRKLTKTRAAVTLLLSISSVWYLSEQILFVGQSSQFNPSNIKYTKYETLLSAPSFRTTKRITDYIKLVSEKSLKNNNTKSGLLPPYSSDKNVEGHTLNTAHVRVDSSGSHIQDGYRKRTESNEIVKPPFRPTLQTKQEKAKNKSLLPSRKPGEKSRYVSLCKKMLNGNHRTGNQLFMLAAMLDLAKRTGRRVVMPVSGWKLDSVFEIDLDRVDDTENDLCPCLDVITPRYDYDDRFDDKRFIENLTASTDHTILLCQLSQTYYHAKNIEAELRSLLYFKPEYLNFAHKFREEMKLEGGCREGRCKQVGVHVRGGDFLLSADLEFGLTIVNYGYLKRAMQYFVEQFGSVQFILTTDDWGFANKIVGNLTDIYNVVKSINHTVGQDFALLSSLDGVLMSTGSFGWWAGWLAGRCTVYYEDWPRKGSRMAREANHERYFPSEWIPLL